MMPLTTQDCAWTSGGVHRALPMGEVGGCACHGHERVLDVVSQHAPDLIRGLNLADEAPDQVRGGRIA